MVSHNRDILLEVRERMDAAPQALLQRGSDEPLPAAHRQPSQEADDAAWIMQLRSVLFQWLERNLAHAR